MSTFEQATVTSSRSPASLGIHPSRYQDSGPIPPPGSHHRMPPNSRSVEWFSPDLGVVLAVIMEYHRDLWSSHVPSLSAEDEMAGNGLRWWLIGICLCIGIHNYRITIHKCQLPYERMHSYLMVSVPGIVVVSIWRMWILSLKEIYQMPF